MALRLDALADDLTLASNPTLGSFTWMGWIYISSWTDWPTFFCINGGHKPCIQAYQGSHNLVLGEDINNSNLGTALSLSTWYHLTWVRAGEQDNKAYLNAVLDIDDTSNQIRNGSSGITLGNQDATSATNHNGRLACVRLWDNVQLPQAEIRQEMYCIHPVRTANLWGCYPIFPGSGERGRDYSGNGRNLTENGTLTDENGPPISYGAPIWYIPFVAAAGGGISGSLDVTLGAATLSGAGVLPIAGTASPTLATASLSAAGTIALTGALDKTLTDAALSGAGALAIAGALSQTLADTTLAATGVGQALTVGMLDAVLEDASVSAAGVLPIDGELAQALEAASLASAGTLLVSGAGNVTLADATLSAAGSLPITGSLAVTFAGATLVATGAETEPVTDWIDLYAPVRGLDLLAPEREALSIPAIPLEMTDGTRVTMTDAFPLDLTGVIEQAEGIEAPVRNLDLYAEER